MLLDEDGEEINLTESEYMELLQQTGMLQQLPPSRFSSARERRSFFNNINKKYFDDLESEKKRKIEHLRKVNFNLNKNTIKGKHH